MGWREGIRGRLLALCRALMLALFELNYAAARNRSGCWLLWVVLARRKSEVEMCLMTRARTTRGWGGQT